MESADRNAPPNPARTEIHKRSVECSAYRREDGLWDFEAVITDSKTKACALPERFVSAGEPIHKMLMRVTVDAQCIIRDVETKTLYSPYRLCGDIAPAYKSLIGLRVGPGFSRAVKTQFRGTEGCTHLTELLPVLATTVFQALSTENIFLDERPGAPGEHLAKTFGVSPFDGCHALRRDGEIVKKYFPAQSEDEKN